MKKTRLKKYAHLIAACGVNVQKGQEVFIRAGVDQPGITNRWRNSMSAIAH